MSLDGPIQEASAHASGGPKPRLQAGVTLSGRYEIDAFLGVGPLGEIYRGRDRTDGKVVLVKLVAPHLLTDGRLRATLEREIQIAAQLDHKNVAQTFGVVEATLGSEPVLGVASELVDGQTLREMLDKKKASGRGFSLKGAYNVVAHLCNALAYAHGATVHGALSIDAVLVNSAGRVKVVDFGLARAVASAGGHAATAAAAPELAQGSATAAADLYAVGAILFELLTGRPPRGSVERMSAVLPEIPPALDDVVEICLRPSPSERYPDAHSLKQALQSALGPDLAPGTTPPPSRAPVPPRPMPPPLMRPPVPGSASGPIGGVASGSAAVASGNFSTPSPPSLPMPSSSRLPQVARAQVARSFNVDSALSAVDDATERWLIQKDKLDFGPFAMREVRSQIEAGKILGEHTIVDTENGERRKVKDHPQLRQLVMETDMRLAQQAREQSDAAQARRHQGRVITILGAIFVLVASVLGGGFFYGKSHHWFEQKVVKEVVHDNADYDFLRGVQISMKVDPPAAKKPHSSGHHARKGGRPGEFDDVTRLGDVSEDGGDETLDQNVVQRVMSSNFKVLVGCIKEERGRNPSMHNVDMDFIIKGTGQVSAVKVNGQTGTAFAGCMYGKMQSVAFPKFNGAKTHASFSLALK